MSTRNLSPIAFPTTGGTPLTKDVKVPPPPYSNSAAQRSDVDILTEFKSFDYLELFHLMDRIIPSRFHDAQNITHTMVHIRVLVISGAIERNPGKAREIFELIELAKTYSKNIMPNGSGFLAHILRDRKQYKLHLLLHKIRTEILVLVGSIYYTSLKPFAMKYICNLIRRWREKHISIMEETHASEVASDLQRTT
ncbi:hypothetical protein C8Q75DRAFT_734522 [Abortiporus biennis]|nr:hypothetical protein C8Q75DRAFT_734522 [Abortiporus biennis]